MMLVIDCNIFQQIENHAAKTASISAGPLQTTAWGMQGTAVHTGEAACSLRGDICTLQKQKSQAESRWRQGTTSRT